MKFLHGTFVLFFFAMAFGALTFYASEAQAQSSYFSSRGCTNCHSDPVTPIAASCNGCHYHGVRSLRGATNKTSYAPGETVSVTLTSSSTRSGWIKAILYDQNNQQVAVSNGNASGMGSSTTFPAVLSAPAPATPGTYTWRIAWFGNTANNGSTHGEAAVNTNSFTVAAPVVTLPTLTVSTLANGSFTSDPTLNVSGNASDPEGIQSVTVNGQGVTVDPDGAFSTAVTLVEGVNAITVVATDTTGSQSSESRTVTFDPQAPAITVSNPSDGTQTAQSIITISGSVSETATVTTQLNGGNQEYAILDGNNFSATLYLQPGVNSIDIFATDQAGNTSNAHRTITLDDASPTLEVTFPGQDITTSNPFVSIRGTVSDALGQVNVKIKFDGQVYNARVTDGDFQRRLDFPAPGRYDIRVIARDEAGNRSVVRRNVIYRPAN